MWGGGPLGPRRRKAEAHVRTAMPVCLSEFLRWKCPSVSLPTPSVNRVMLSVSAVNGPKERLRFHRHRKEHIASRSSRRPGLYRALWKSWGWNLDFPRTQNLEIWANFSWVSKGQKNLLLTLDYTRFSKDLQPSIL